jgi:HPt (histidine-containing phosphotransfer) domain-containing protein
MEGEAAGSDLDRRLDAIWRRSRPAILTRIDEIERGAAADADITAIATARAEAHKLRGLLGTIGIAEGSTLAAAIEEELEAAAQGTGTAGWQGRVTGMLTRLRAETDAR